MIIDIPGYDKNEFTDILFDFNGTLAIDGKIIEKIKDKFIVLSDSLRIHIVTGDTYGNVLKQVKDFPCKLHIIPSTNQAEEKLKYLMSLDSEKTIAVGNGRNDNLILSSAGLGIAVLQKEGLFTKTLTSAGLGIAVLQKEGLFTKTLTSADLIYTDIIDVIDALLKPNRLKASLRN